MISVVLMDYDDDGGVGVGGGCGRCTTANSSAADADERSVDSASTSGPESSTRSLPLASVRIIPEYNE